MPISKSRLVAIVLALGILPTQLWAADDTQSLQVADLGGVSTWRAGGDTVIFIKNRANEWYRADMKETCMKLDTSKGVNFVTELDPATNQKTSSVVVDRHICKITSLKKVDAPDPVAK